MPLAGTFRLQILPKQFHHELARLRGMLESSGKDSMCSWSESFLLGGEGSGPTKAARRGSSKSLADVFSVMGSKLEVH